MVPTVSVVLPAWNAQAGIASAIESIQCQTWSDWELLIVDDGSTDQTLGIAKALAKRDSRIRWISQTHQGIVSALNAGLHATQGQFIARMDADDESYPDRLGQQADLLLRQPGLGLAGSLVEFAGDAVGARGYALHVEWMNSILTETAIRHQRFIESPFAHPSVMFRRDLVEKFGSYRHGQFPEDYELWLRWLDCDVRMAKVPRVLLKWHDRPERLSRQDSRYASEAFYQCKAVYLARWLKRSVEPTRSVLVWGAGRLTRCRADYLIAEGVSIAGYIDIDPAKIGRCIAGRPVIGPSKIPSRGSCFVLGYVGKRGARELARSYLLSRGFHEGQDFLMAA